MTWSSKHNGFAIALSCVGLSLVVASVMFFDAFRPNGPTNAVADSTVDPLRSWRLAAFPSEVVHSHYAVVHFALCAVDPRTNNTTSKTAERPKFLR
jgi:hypothetical protein